MIKMSTKQTAAGCKAKLEAKHAERERKLMEEHVAEEVLACEIEEQEEQERREEEEKRQVEEAWKAAEEFWRLEEEQRLVEFRRMEQERKEGEAAEAVEDRGHLEEEDMMVLSWEENLAREKKRMRAEAAAEASKVGNLRVGPCWPCTKQNAPCIRDG